MKSNCGIRSYRLSKISELIRLLIIQYKKTKIIKQIENCFSTSKMYLVKKKGLIGTIRE